MKKLTFFLATIFPISALAVTEQSKDTKQQADEPHIYLSIFDRTQMPQSIYIKKKFLVLIKMRKYVGLQQDISEKKSM